MRNYLAGPLGRRLSLFALSLCFPLAIPAGAQQTSSPAATQDEINRQLLQRLQEVEEEVKQLKAQLAATSAAAPLPAAVAVPAPAAAPAVVAAPAAAEAEVVNEVAPRLKLEIFGDVAAQSVSHDPDTFLFGSLDLFATSRLSSKINTLGELLFIAENDNSISVDVERLLFIYRQNKYFKATVGRYHTWVGYYNSHYNKAEYLETTTDRPFVYAIHDQGAFYPCRRLA